MTQILQEDLDFIYSQLSQSEKEKLSHKNILLTGYAGSLGYILMAFFQKYGDNLNINKIYAIDNFIFGKPVWLHSFSSDSRFILIQADITSCDLECVQDSDIIFHMASLASPVYYRLHPIETIDADVLGLRRLLDFFKTKSIDNLLFFSTSEVYGDPSPNMVPTKESYWGNVNTSGPRACYDESKRFGETLCYNYHVQYNMNITIIRPFNSFGPGLRTNDKRVVADFALNVLNNEDIVIYSDGKATRTFCYATDTTLGILKCALYGQYDIFNIGSDEKEMTIDELASMYQQIGHNLTGYSGKIVYQTHEDKHYLTDNPKRRCPDLTKARYILGYAPSCTTANGIKRYLQHLTEERSMFL